MRGMCLTAALFFLQIMLPQRGGATVSIVPDSYPGIRSAVISSSAGDTILVRNGHSEPAMVLVDKAVWIHPEESGIVTITAGSSDAYAVRITADGATYQADSTTVSNSTFQNNELDDITAAGDNSHIVSITNNNDSSRY